MNRILISLFLALPCIGFTQQVEANTWRKKLKDYKIQPIVAFQLWSTYTSGAKIYDEENGEYKYVDNRFNTQLRRSRIGLKGQPYEQLKFNMTAALDLVGRDLLTGTEGGGNNGGSPKFRIWNAYLQWRLLAKKESLNLVTGYFTPQIGRESITSAMRVSSMEKSWSQNYLRRHLTGIGPGRAMGINIGGLLGETENKISFKYDIGLFNPVFQAYAGNSEGKNASPLIVGRLLINFGDPESETYTIGHSINYLGKRNGLSMAFSGARQGSTDLFHQNYAAGLDFLYNWGNWNVNGEWTFLWREGIGEYEGTPFTVKSNTGFIRLSYNLPLKKDLMLEPVLMLVQFNGEMKAEGQAKAVLVGSDSGKDQYVDIGFNLYFNSNLKMSLHGTLRSGKPGYTGDGAIVNQYFYQTNIGAIQRGDWVGLGMVAIF